MNPPPAIDSDMFSSLDEELITDTKRPSLMSLTSDDSHFTDDDDEEEDEDEDGDKTAATEKAACSTPIMADPEFKMPTPALQTKRYSLSVFNESAIAYNMNKSNSMHDVSSLACFSPLRRDSCMFSTETLQSNSIATTKSKDSGFQRSTSCTSLNTTASKKYDHVQSKVKQYIQSIKQSEALRKMQKRLHRDDSIENLEMEESPPRTGPSGEVAPVSKKELLDKVKELQEEIKERDCVIEQLEKNHSELRLKYAAAETRIDDLRIKVSQNENSMSYISDEKVAELLTNNLKSSRRLTFTEINKPTIVRANEQQRTHGQSGVCELQPIKKFCSSSVRLNETYPLLSANSAAVLKSNSCQYVRDVNYHLSKSASSIDRDCGVFRRGGVADLPYEKNSFAKVT